MNEDDFQQLFSFRKHDLLDDVYFFHKEQRKIFGLSSKTDQVMLTEMEWFPITEVFCFDRSLSLYLSEAFDRYPILEFSGIEHLKIYIDNASSVFPFIFKNSSVTAYKTIEIFHPVFFKHLPDNLNLVSNYSTRKLYRLGGGETLIHTECETCLPIETLFDLPHKIYLSTPTFFGDL